jgi:thiol-disulfide isomerase/thioredoxin
MLTVVCLFLSMKLITLLLFAVLATGVAAQNIPVVKMADVVQRMNQPNDTTYIINFWATFCKPCVQEMPGFLKVAEKYKNQKVKLLLVSVDLPAFYPKRIADFVTKNKWKASIAWLNETNADYFCPMIDSAWSGAIPATVVVNAKRGYKKFWEGEVKEGALNKELNNIIEVQKKNGYLGRFHYPMNDVIKVDFPQKPPATFTGTRNWATSFYSDDSTVYSLTGGVVQTIVCVDEITFVIVKKSDLYVTYSNLKRIKLNKGDSVKVNDIIGYAGKNLDDEIAVDIYLSTQEGNLSLRKENFIARSHNDFYSLPPKGIEPQ